MSVIGRLIEGLRAIGRSTSAARCAAARVVRARYAAQITPDYHRHWELADGLSADAAALPAVRRTLRNRARYEVANNSYARGTGPRLQLLGIAGEDARTVERTFMDWTRAIDLPEKLRLVRVAQAEDGEAFAC